MIDPRWAIVEAFADDMAAGKSFEADQFVEAFEKFAAALEGLAADEAIPEVERRQAQSIIDEMARSAVPHKDLALKALHRISKESGDETIRQEAVEALKAVTDRMPTPTKSQH